MGTGGTGAPSRSPAVRRTSSHRLLHFSQKLKAGAMSRAKQLSQDLTRRFTRTQGRAIAEPSSGIESALAALSDRRQRAIRCLRLISDNSKSKASSIAWIEVQRNFDRLAREGELSRTDFPQCIGMAESKEFATELFDALGRRRQMEEVDRINKEELREIWQQITDSSSDSRLQIIFHMSPFWYDLIRVDEDADGIITEAEVKEVESILETYGKLKPGSACHYVTSSRNQLYQKREDAMRCFS